VEKTMQEEAEKIELELPEGEVDVREADVDDSVVESNTAEIQVEEVKTSSDDELDKISESVQKRIDKLTYKMREAERQRDEAVNYAQNVHDSNSQLKENKETPMQLLVQQNNFQGVQLKLKILEDFLHSNKLGKFLTNKNMSKVFHSLINKRVQILSQTLKQKLGLKRMNGLVMIKL
jgi:hypothetical protein